MTTLFELTIIISPNNKLIITSERELPRIFHVYSDVLFCSDTFTLWMKITLLNTQDRIGYLLCTND